MKGTAKQAHPPPAHPYVTQNGKVVRETIGTGTTEKVLDFVYDNSGKPFALTYTDGTAEPQRYYYVLNLQGDVVALMTADRTIVARYAYNAWGKVLSVTGENGNAITSASHIVNLNPIRYRGYYYDTETGFYYLQSRYYDPANHRFINADCYASTGTGFLGYNMFAYCNTNPVMYYDPEGTGILSVIVVIIAAGALLTGCFSEERKNWPNDCPYEYWGSGGGRQNANCYGYVFGYQSWVNPGAAYQPYFEGKERYYNYDPDGANVVYNRSFMIKCVTGDASIRGRTVIVISSPAALPEGAYLVVCKLTSDGKDYHFAVRTPDGDWIDKPGRGESRYNKIDGLADSWVIGDTTYDHDTVYFAYFKDGGSK